MSKAFMTMIVIISLSTFINAQTYSHKREAMGGAGGTASSEGITNRAITCQIAVGTANDDNHSHGAGFIWPFDWQTFAEEKDAIPTVFELSQNYPNPFNPNTTIMYSLPERSYVTLDIFNILGQKKVTLVDEYQDAGTHTVIWQANDISSGVYFYRIVAGDNTESRKLLLLK
jgi:hypothetical protein